MKLVNLDWDVMIFPVPGMAYADDIALLASDSHHLQKLVNKITACCLENDVIINTEIMHFRHKRSKQHLYYFYYNDQVLDYCSEYKYLGVGKNSPHLLHGMDSCLDNTCLNYAGGLD